MSSKLTLAAVTMSLVTSGCVAAGIGGTTYAVKASGRNNYIEAAESGDAEAQYKLGLSHCCMGVGFSTQTATEWLCKAAHQDHRRAQYELGRIYLGEVSRTPAPGQKVIRAVTAKSDQQSAFIWLTLAASDGDVDASKKLSKLADKMAGEDLAQASQRLEAWREMPCEYRDVFGENADSPHS